MKIKRSFRHIKLFDAIGGVYVEKHKDNKENKISAAIKSMSKQVAAIVEQHNESLEEKQLDNVLTDKDTGAILKDDKGNRQFSVEGNRKLNSALKELMKKEYEIHSRVPLNIDQKLIDALDSTEKEYFSELVIPKQTPEDDADYES